MRVAGVRWRTTYALWRFMCLYSYVWYKSTVPTCLYTYEDRIEPQRCTRNVTLPASAVGGGRSREGSSHRAGTWAPVEQNVTSGQLGNIGIGPSTLDLPRAVYSQKAKKCSIRRHQRPTHTQAPYTVPTSRSSYRYNAIDSATRNHARNLCLTSVQLYRSSRLMWRPRRITAALHVT